MTDFHPDLSAARFIPRFSFGPRVAWLLRTLSRWSPVPAAPACVTITEITVPGAPGGPEVRLRIYRPDALVTPAPALLWMHGGGFIIGDPMQDEASSAGFAASLGIVVAAVRYRLAPDAPFPAPLDDCYAGLRGLHAAAAALGIDPERIAIGGDSAGAGLAAGLALLAHDRGEVKPAFQLLVYPMLDDRTVTRADIDASVHRVWSVGSNRYGWSAYLAREPGSDGVSPYAAPARRDDLAGLAPAWIGVGTFDLFHDEDVAYAARLRAAGVPCDLLVIPGAYHGFDVVSSTAPVSRAFREAQLDALRRGLSR